MKNRNIMVTRWTKIERTIVLDNLMCPDIMPRSLDHALDVINEYHGRIVRITVGTPTDKDAFAKVKLRIECTPDDWFSIEEELFCEKVVNYQGFDNITTER